MPIQSLFDLPAPAKLNLFLHVVGRRPDGYHLLQSAFVLIDWCDTLHFERRSDGQLLRHDLNTLLPQEDLCLRAARALQTASGCAWGCDISIDKQLPSGAGLGGGSSDAATVLLALNRLWGLNWSRKQLQAVALPIGADVPFFVGGDNAWVEGIGELLTPLLLRPHMLAVVKPPSHVDTGTIFSSPNLERQNEPATISGFLGHGLADGNSAITDAKAGGRQVASRGWAGEVSTDALFHGFGRNDLQPVVEAAFPEVAQAAVLLRGLFGNSRMTGTGSAVFATVDESSEALNRQERERIDQGACRAAAATLLEDHLSANWPENWVSRVCQSLAHHPLKSWVPDEEAATN